MKIKKYNVRDAERKNGRAHFFPEETLIENLEGRFDKKPTKQYKVLLMELLEKEGLKAEKIYWSQYAGCSMCPCSPGFIMKGLQKDIYVYVK